MAESTLSKIRTKVNRIILNEIHSALISKEITAPEAARMIVTLGAKPHLRYANEIVKDWTS